mmetsp:Transcript_105816/g.207545  ORF Transcript_105816/g.207545 Transcript_105816/m.207545 type:complete len:234 (+) Transcript_105816:64-765(+)
MDAASDGDFRAELLEARAIRRVGYRQARPLDGRGLAPAAPPEPCDRASPSRCSLECDEARAMLGECNSFRRQRGCESLAWNSRLAGIAERAARAMALGEVPFSHSGAPARFAEYPLGAGDTFAENLARSEGIRPLAAAVVTGWRDSPGHCRNLLGPFTACGIGTATDGVGVTFVVQLLALVPGDVEMAVFCPGAFPGSWLAAGEPSPACRALLGLAALALLLFWKGGWLVVSA